MSQFPTNELIQPRRTSECGSLTEYGAVNLTALILCLFNPHQLQSLYFDLFLNLHIVAICRAYGLDDRLVEEQCHESSQVRLQGNKLPTFSFAEPSIASANELIPIRAVELLPRRAHCYFPMWIA